MTPGMLRFSDWTSPVPPADREVVTLLAEGGEERPPVLFVPGLGHGAWAFAVHWIAHTAARGFPAHALTPRAGGDLRAQVHDVVQVAAGPPPPSGLGGPRGGAPLGAAAPGRCSAPAAGAP